MQTFLMTSNGKLDQTAGFRDQMFGLVVGVAAVSEKLHRAADVSSRSLVFSFAIVPQPIWFVRSDFTDEDANQFQGSNSAVGPA